MKRFGLIGFPLGHSFSKNHFENKFAELDLNDHYYDLFELPEIAHFKNLVDTKELVGLNVTIPHKSSIIPFLDELSDAARKIGAVNCLHRSGKKWIGYNTDAPAFQATLAVLINGLKPKALILGTGGASKAVEYALKNLGIIYQFASRSKKDSAILYSEITPEHISGYGLVINCTPLGTYPNIEETPPIPLEAFHAGQLVYDLVYNPQETKLLSLAKAQGAQVKNGFEMLQLQADLGWGIWSH